MNEILWTLFFLSPVILGGGILIFMKGRKKTRISSRKKKEYFAAIDRIAEKGGSERIIGYDKILSHILSDLGYRGSVADQLKKKPKPLSRDIEEVWRLHKIRNQIAHELHASFDEEGDPKAFEKILRSLLLKV